MTKRSGAGYAQQPRLRFFGFSRQLCGEKAFSKFGKYIKNLLTKD
jgi:hypothetical protein